MELKLPKGNTMGRIYKNSVHSSYKTAAHYTFGRNQPSSLESAAGMIRYETEVMIQYIVILFYVFYS